MKPIKAWAIICSRQVSKYTDKWVDDLYRVGDRNSPPYLYESEKKARNNGVPVRVTITVEK